MADKKISELNSLTGANAADGDLVAIVDVSATETKKITRSEFFTDTPSIDVGGTVTATGFVTTGDMTFGDNDKAIFGAGSDLQIYHDGSHSRIQDVGAGDLILSAENDLRLETYTGNVPYINCNYADSVQLAFNGDWKLATTSTGIDVTGTVTADGLTVNSASFPTGLIKVKQDSDATRNRGIILEANADDSMLAIGYSNGKFSLAPTYNTSGSFEPLSVFTSNQERLSVDTNGDISFYEDTGTTPKFFWDASAESLGIGTSSPSSVIDARQTSTGASTQIRVYNTDNSNTTTQTAALFLSPDSRGNGALIFAEKENADFSTTAARDISLVFSPVLNNSQTQAMRIDSSGNVGIGTSSPSSYTANGNNLVIEDTNVGMTLASNTTTGAGAIYFADGTAGTNPYRGIINYLHTSDSMGFFTAATERLRIDSSGNVGIGNTTSGYVFTAGETRLTVGDGAEHAAIQVYSGTTKWGGIAFSDDAVDVAAQGFIGYYHPDNYMVFNTAGAEAVRIDSSGNLLVGTTNVNNNGDDGVRIKADGTLQVRSDNSGFVATLNRSNASDGDILTFAKSNTTVGSIGTFNGDTVMGTGLSAVRFNDGVPAISPHRMDTNNTHDASTDLGQATVRFKDLYLSGGVSNPTAGGTLTFSTTGSERMRIDASGNLLINGTTTVGYKFHLYGDAAFERTGTTSQTMVAFRNGNGNVGTISTSGSSTAYNTSSDYRLKTDAQPMVGASDRVLALKPCNFAWKADGTRVDGFLAHEAQAVVPEAVTGEKDGEEMQAIDHSKLVPLLTAALQEALTEINNLKARVATLEG